MKRRMVSLYVMICAGILLFSGCTGAETEQNTSDNRINDTQSDAQNDPQDDAVSDDGDIAAGSTFKDSNDLFKSADFSGRVSGCSETTCTIGA